jgi:hypothetical protein
LESRFERDKSTFCDAQPRFEAGMTFPSIFDLCKPRDDVVQGTIADSDYAANLANVLNRSASSDYLDAPTFFTNTYPTEGSRSFSSMCAVGFPVAETACPQCSAWIPRLEAAKPTV